MAPIPPSASVLTPLTNLLKSRTPLNTETSATSKWTIRNISPNALSRTLAQLLHKRQTDPSLLPTTYGSINSGPSPGTVAGIVLGSVAGFLLLLWLIYTCLNAGQWGGSESTESVVVRDRRKSRGSTRSRRASETIEVVRPRSPVRIVRPAPPPERVERVIVEERRETRRERSRAGSDEVVVIEEHSPPPRRTKSKKYRKDDGGYRTVDPMAYGGVVGGRRN